MSDYRDSIVKWLKETTDGKVCSRCGEPADGIDAGWRWNGTEWEHHCEDAHPQVGHFIAVPEAEYQETP